MWKEGGGGVLCSAVLSVGGGGKEGEGERGRESCDLPNVSKLAVNVKMSGNIFPGRTIKARFGVVFLAVNGY